MDWSLLASVLGDRPADRGLAAPRLARWPDSSIPPPSRVGKGIDAVPMFLLRLFGHRRPSEMGWKRYAVALLAFNAALFVLSFAVLWAQDHLPLNPDGKGPLTALGYKDAAGVEHKEADTAVIFNTVCSFVTNTNLQHYSGEQHLTYFSQLGGIVWLQFVTPACGLAVMLAVIRGLRGDKHLGDFYLDTARSVVFVLMPLALVLAVLLVSCGMPMTFQGAAQAKTLEGGTQTIAMGPVAAEVAIKQLGTNGGGFFGPNSAHPYENPTPWSNILEVVSIILVPMASIVMFGLMIKDRAHAAVVFGVMMALLLTGAGIAIWAELQPSSATDGLAVARARNMEGKEVRNGPVASATWAAMTTATSNGSVNSMHDSFQPLGGVAPMSLMMLNVDFSGIGAGFLNMLMYVITAVFLAGLMVGRTPEYLGKKIEAREVKLAMVALLDPSAPDLLRRGAIRGQRLGPCHRRQPRPARLQRDPLRVHLGIGQQRLGVRGPGGQQPAVEHRHRHRALARPVPRAGAADRHRRLPFAKEAGSAVVGDAPDQ